MVRRKNKMFALCKFEEIVFRNIVKIFELCKLYFMVIRDWVIIDLY